LSACVIDHLWHLTETGYYHRQGGPYPPFTWKIESIVDHKHQQAAYCGIHYFDSDAYPPEYRDRLVMGNIHGNCINVDVLERRGSTYFATPRPDFLSANDAWFMPVAQKTGPDGCLYVLDWYDRYHCYQDARRDPKGIDRLKGRLYRIRYKNNPRVTGFDLSKETDDELIERLHSKNDYFRGIAQRLLCERNHEQTNLKLQRLILNNQAPKKTRMHALWALVSAGRLQDGFHQILLNSDDASLRAWGVRAAGNQHEVSPQVLSLLYSKTEDHSPDVLLQLAIASQKIDKMEPVSTLLKVLAKCGDDALIPHIVWQNLYPLLDDQSPHFLELIERDEFLNNRNVLRLMPRVVDRILASRKVGIPEVAGLVAVLLNSKQDTSAAENCLAVLTERIQTGEINSPKVQQLKRLLEPKLVQLYSGNQQTSLALTAALVSATWQEPRALEICHAVLRSNKRDDNQRAIALQALITANEKSLIGTVDEILASPKQNSQRLRESILASLGRLERAEVGTVVLKHYPKMEAELKPKAIELLTGRTKWSHQLLEQIGKKQIPTNALNVNQVRKLLNSPDKKLLQAVQKHWGTIRTQRDPKREELIAKMKVFLQSSTGDAVKGRQIFKKVCGQCHKMYGEGQEVGPDITLNGRASFTQLLSNVFDPSLVIGASYQGTTVVTTQGRVITGLLAEDSAQRIVLKVQGGKLETIARNDVEISKRSELSLMPEGLEKQIKPDEMLDLFAYITLTRPPEDPAARLIPGTKVKKR